MFLRLFDVNFDGFIDKKEFRWMTTSELVSWKTIDLVFEVGTFLRWMLATLQAFPAAHVLIGDDLKYAANDPQYAEQRGRLVDCNAKATHRCRNCKTVDFFPAPVQTIAILFSVPEMWPGPQWEARLPGVQGDDFPESGEERSSPEGGTRTGKKSNPKTTFLFI